MTDQFLRGSSSRSRRSPICASPDNKTGSRRYEGARRLIQAAALGGRLVKRLRTAAAPLTGAREDNRVRRRGAPEQAGLGEISRYFGPQQTIWESSLYPPCFRRSVGWSAPIMTLTIVASPPPTC